MIFRKDEEVACGKTRNSFVESLRLLCVFGIILMHKNGFILDIAKGHQVFWIIFVNVFNFESSLLMLISAYYGNPRAPRKRLLKFWLMIVFYRYIPIVIEIITGTFSIGGDFDKLVRRLFPVFSGSSWFVSGYILIWLCAPYFEKMIDYLSQEEYLTFVITLTMIFVIVPTFIMYGPISNSGKDVGTLFTFYCVGRYLKRYGKLADRPIQNYIFLAIVSLVGQMLINGLVIFLWQNVLGKAGVILPFSWDHSFTELILSMALIGLSTKVCFCNKFINYAGKRAYGILMAEEFAIVPIVALKDYASNEFGMIYIILVVALTLFIMLEGLIVESLRRLFFNNFEAITISYISIWYHKIMSTLFSFLAIWNNKKSCNPLE